MKVLILLFILTITNYANETIVIPEDVCIYHLEKVVKDGWSDSNATLNSFIIKSGTQAIPRILKQLHKPLSIKGGYLLVENHYVPKFLITRDDYTQLFAYVKYLEHKGEEEKAYKIYIDALRGLNGTESKSMMSMIFRMVNEKIILTSLRESLKRNRFSEQIKSNLKKELKELLLLDKRLLLETIEYGEIVNNAFTNQALSKNARTQEEKLMKKSYIYMKTYMNDNHTKLIHAIKTNSLKEYEINCKKERDEFESFSNMSSFMWSSISMKVHDILSLDYNNTRLAQQLAKSNSTSYTPRIFDTYDDYLKQVKNNQKLLENLEMRNI